MVCVVCGLVCVIQSNVDVIDFPPALFSLSRNIWRRVSLSRDQGTGKTESPDVPV